MLQSQKHGFVACFGLTYHGHVRLAVDDSQQPQAHRRGASIPDCVRLVKTRVPSTGILVYNPLDTQGLLFSFSRRSYPCKGMSHLKLLEAIRSVRTGHTYLPRSIRNSVPGKLNRPALSPREMDILRLIVRGLCNQEIAEALNITRGTVKWHVNIILRRLGVTDRTQAVVVAAQRGIVEI